MKWFQFHCWCNSLGTALSPCRKHCQSELLQFHYQSRHCWMELLLWSAADTITKWQWITWSYCFVIQCNLPSTGNPSCLQTTLASRLSQELSQTVPHSLPRHISTVPCFRPLLSRICPSAQLSGTAKHANKMCTKHFGCSTRGLKYICTIQDT